MTMWMVRAGRNGRWIEDFVSKNVVGLGWHGVGNSLQYASKEEIFDAMRNAYPDMSEGTAASGASQLWRFRNEVAVGDAVVTYDAGAREYYLGKIISDPRYQAGEIEELTLQRSVEWWPEQVDRDMLSDDSRNRLGSTLTLFKVPADTETELTAKAVGQPQPIIQSPIEDEVIDPFSEVIEEAALRVADRISRLDWYNMQRLVAALLRAMGYRTEVSPVGPDRGKDIFASPDGFGFEQPRIAVEVKHRRGEKVDAPAIRSFVGGRHKDDRGLYVSTGGFSRDAYYEADRSNIPLKLMTLDDLARAVIDNYEGFDSEGRAILPLTKLYWPA